MEKDFIRFKLDYLKKQKDELHSLLDTQVDKVLHKGDVWLQGTADTQDCVSYTFKQISNAIEQTVVFLGQKYLELSKLEVTFDTTDTTENSAQSFGISPTSSQVMKPSENFSAEPELTMKRLERLEEAVAILTTSMNNVTEERKCLKETKVTQESESEETTFHWQRLEEELESLKREMREIKQKVNNVEVGCNYGEAFGALGRRVDKLESLQADLQKVEQLRGLEKDVNELKSTLASSNHQSFAYTLEKLDNIQIKVDEIGEKAEKIDDLKERIDNFENLQERIEEYESGVKEIQKLNRINEGRLEHLECVTNSLSTKGDESISNIQTLVQTTSTTETTLRDIITSQEQERNTLTELQNKLTAKERRDRRAQKTMTKKFDDVELQYKMVCKIVADRLVPLEKLREKLNSNVKYRDENIKKLHDVVQKVAVLEPRVSQVEQIAIRPAIGFSAALEAAQRPVKGGIINYFTDVISNTMGCYNSETGVFTAPVDGLYGLYLSLWQWHDGSIMLNAVRTCSHLGSVISGPMSDAETIGEDTGHNSFTVIELHAGDGLFVGVKDFTKRPRMAIGTTFSCFLIGAYSGARFHEDQGNHERNNIVSDHYTEQTHSSGDWFPKDEWNNEEEPIEEPEPMGVFALSEP